jgi:hypothetical protein
MKIEEYNRLKELKNVKQKVIDKDFLMPYLADRTLLYGYTCDRNTWHVYIKDCIIHKVIYRYDTEPVEYEVNDNTDFIPDKRLYPEMCDYKFCLILQRLGYELPFTAWNDERLEQQYYGKIIE